ncbi:MAG TPA: hypothetical protein VLA03_05700 [Draconibacterium sp.]|nr:hypothetical protein [Draconibacterium sp.]
MCAVAVGVDKSIFIDAIDMQHSPSRLVGTGSCKRGAGEGQVKVGANQGIFS